MTGRPPVIEQEVKLTAATPALLDDVLNSKLIQTLDTGANRQDATRYLAHYYDTEARALRARRYSLRARREGARWKAALKYGGVIEDGYSRRHELEADISGWLDNAAQLPPGELRDKTLAVIPAEAPLEVVVQVDMRRSIRNLVVDGAAIELAADRAAISGGASDRRVMLYEIELELKHGAADKMLELGARLREQFALTPSTQTKHRIGLQLE